MNLLPRKIEKVAVIGGGLMSSEIVALLVLMNYQVILKEKNRKHLLEEINKIKGKFRCFWGVKIQYLKAVFLFL